MTCGLGELYALVPGAESLDLAQALGGQAQASLFPDYPDPEQPAAWDDDPPADLLDDPPTPAQALAVVHRVLGIRRPDPGA